MFLLPLRAIVFVAVSVLGAMAFGGEPPRLLNREGKLCSPLGEKASPLTVFLFVRADRPIANEYAPEISRLEQKFGSRGVGFWLVYPDADETAATIAAHGRSFGLSLRALRDPRHELVKYAGITVTPEAALFSRASGELYHGRIDNRYFALGQSRPAATDHDLEEAIELALAGQSVPKESKPAIGCFTEEVQ